MKKWIRVRDGGLVTLKKGTTPKEGSPYIPMGEAAARIDVFPEVEDIINDVLENLLGASYPGRTDYVRKRLRLALKKIQDTKENEKCRE